MADRPARVADVHEIAASMPHATRIEGPKGNSIYQVGGKSFVFFRTPRPDAKDPATGEPYPDVIVIWVESDADKQALIQDPTTPFFSTDHFNGHLSVLVREADLHAISKSELAEVVQDAWLSRASNRRRAAWLAAHGTDGPAR
ncbi:MmcQ/YjbR family DNA-binding protein [Mycobacterium sp. SMC-11]|uniref:MmcQ/YjbR family DNA-binding protein n=1 Tax=Mycobacterium sp. SMC-11 TaxID=3385969 RepID=UPI00390CB2A6